MDRLVENTGLVGRHIEELYARLLRSERRSDRLQRALDVIIPRFNGFFRYEADAEAAWDVFMIALGEADRPFPSDSLNPDRPAPNFLSRDIR